MSDINHRAELLETCVGGTEAFDELAAQYGITQQLTQVEKVAIATIVFNLGPEVARANRHDLHSPTAYEVVRGDIMLAEYSRHPDPHYLAVHSLYEHIKAMPQAKRMSGVLALKSTATVEV